MDDLEGPGRLLYASGAEVDDLMTFFVERSKAGEESQVGALHTALPSTQTVFLFLKKIYQGIPAKPINKKRGVVRTPGKRAGFLTMVLQSTLKHVR